MKNPFKSLKENVVRYIMLRIKEIYLSVMEQSAKLIGVIFMAVVLAFFIFTGIFFIAFGFGVWLGKAFDSLFLGMFCVGIILLVFAIIVGMLMKPFVRWIAGKVAVRLARKIPKLKNKPKT